MSDPRPICASCQMRFYVGSSPSQDAPINMRMTASQWSVLRQFAAEFDEMARHNWGALDFLDWLAPSLLEPVTPAEAKRVKWRRQKAAQRGQAA